MYNNLQGKKIYIYTLGCKVNQYESDAMYESLEAAGCTRSDGKSFDICIINTCSVTNMADHKSRQIINRMRAKNPDALITATGCYVQANSAALLESGAVDFIFGNNRKKDVVRLISEFMESRVVNDNFIDVNKDPEFESLRVSMPETHTRAYIKIQDGCNMFCTYCIIPFLRGRIKNKPFEDIISEVEGLVQNGIKEIVLTGINLSSYGDIGEFSLADVICRLAKIDGLMRIRLGSLEPRVITDEFMERISQLPNVCPHFHLSLQSGSTEVLKNMHRRYTADDIKTIVARIRRYYDRPALTSDIIVGFPQESEDNFEETYKTLSEINLYEMHVFKFSRRKGTIADGMSGQIPEKIKSERSDRLLALKEQQMKAYEESFRGENVSVLVEEIIEKDGVFYYRGHSERYLLIDIPCIGEPDKGKINTFMDYCYEP